MGRSRKLSVSVDGATLDELKVLIPGITVSFLVDEALRQRLARARLLRLLDEWDAESPISPDERREGEKLWREAVSSSIQVRSRLSQREKERRGSPSAKPSKKRVKSLSRPS